MSELGTAFVKVMPDMSGLNARVGAYFTSSQWKKMGTAAGVSLGAGLAAGTVVKGLYEIGEAFDSAYDKMEVQTGAQGKALGKLKRDFKNVVSAVPADFNDASEAVGGLSQRLDLQGKPLKKLSKQLLEFSRITDTDVGQNVQSVTRLFGDWSIATGDQSKTLDKLFRASQATGVGVSDLSDLMVQFGSPLRQLGLDFDTAVAMFSRFEKEGVNIQTLMPGLRMALKNFSAPSDDLSASLDKLGISLKDGPAAALQETFDVLKQAPTDLEANATAFEIFGARAGPDMAAAVREGRFELDDLMKTIEDGKTTIRDAGKDTMNFGEQWTLLKNNVFVALEPLASKVFEGIGDEMKRITDILTDKSLTTDEKFTAVMDEIQRVAQKWGPKVAEAGGKLGVSLIKGIAGAFADSPILGKIFIGGAALKLFGGAGALSKLGAAIGGKVAGSMATTVAAETAAGSGKWSAVGTAASRFLGPALAAGVVFEIGQHKDEIADALNDAIPHSGDWIKFDPLPSLDNLFNSNPGHDPFSPLELAIQKMHIIQQGAVTDTKKDLHRLLGEYEGTGRKINKSVIWQWAENGKISAEGAQRLIDIYARVKVQGGQALQDLSVKFKHEGEVVKGFADVGADALDRLTREGDKSLRDLAGRVKKTGDSIKDFSDIGSKSLQGFADKTDRSAHDAAGSFGWLTDKSGKMAKGVAGNNDSMVNAVGSGFGILKENLNKALTSFQVKKVNYAIKKTNQALHVVGADPIGAQKGAIVPGTGSGDTVPLHIGGRLAAMVEPREMVSVLNRKATAALMAVNKRIPRFQKGGPIGEADFGGHPSNVIPGIRDLIATMQARFPLGVTSTTDHSTLTTTGNVSDHSTGNAVDMAGSTSVMYKASEWIKQSGLYRQLKQGIHNPNLSVNAGQIVPGYFTGSTWTDHIDHIHLAMAGALNGDFGAAAQKLARLILTGPNGPEKKLGQGVLDKGLKAANALLAKQSPSVPTGLTGTDVGGGFEKVWNAVNPDLGKWTNLMGRIVQVESSGDPHAGGPGTSNPGHAGWYQYDAPTYAGDRGKGGWPEGAWNPEYATAAAGNAIRSDGMAGVIQRWTTWDGVSPHLKKGGLVPMLAAGGIPGWDAGLGSPFGKGGKGAGGKFAGLIDKIQAHVKKIAEIDERIDIATTTSSTASSPSGSDYSSTELKNLIGLNQGLLGSLTSERDLVREAIKLSGTKVKGLERRIDHSPLTREIARHHDKVKDLRKAMAGIGGGKLGDLKDRLKGATGKEKDAIQHEIDRLTHDNQKKVDAIQHDIDKEQKLIKDLRVKQGDRKSHLKKRMGKFKSRGDWLSDLLVEAQGVTGGGGRIFETTIAIDELQHTGIGSSSMTDLSGLRSVIEASQFGVFKGMFGTGGSLGRNEWGIAGETGQPEIVKGPATVLSPAATEQIRGRKYIGTANVDLGRGVQERLDMEFEDREREDELAGFQAGL